ncbi:hypothetical protein Agub_g13345, partial [Astrephomene gubernaculifera]
PNKRRRQAAPSNEQQRRPGASRTTGLAVAAQQQQGDAVLCGSGHLGQSDAAAAAHGAPEAAAHGERGDSGSRSPGSGEDFHGPEPPPPPLQQEQQHAGPRQGWGSAWTRRPVLGANVRLATFPAVFGGGRHEEEGAGDEEPGLDEDDSEVEGEEDDDDGEGEDDPEQHRPQRTQR